MRKECMPDIIILIPGIMGSVLHKNDRDVWALTPGSVLRGLVMDGSDLVLEGDEKNVDYLEDRIRATRLFPDTHLIPGLWKIDGYSKIRDYIKSNFEVTEGENYFEFPYDWRRDNRVAARLLAEKAGKWLSAWKQSSGNISARLVLVCHSMGGLIARYYLEVLQGWRVTRSLITFGTPYRGSLNALNFLCNGLTKKIGPITLVDLSEVLRTFTSVYQLLPIYPCYKDIHGQLIRVSEATDIPNLKREKAEAALLFHTEIRDAVACNLLNPEYKAIPYVTYPVVGTHQPTLQSAVLLDGKCDIRREHEGKDLGGDGTVPRVSAVPIEWSEQKGAMFAAEQHGSIQNSDTVLIHFEDILRGNAIDLTIFQAEGISRGPIRLALDVDDLYAFDEPITLRVRPEREVKNLDARITNVATGEEKTATLYPSNSEWYTCEPTTLSPGTYRVTVSGKRPVMSVSSVFLVA